MDGVINRRGPACQARRAWRADSARAHLSFLQGFPYAVVPGSARALACRGWRPRHPLLPAHPTPAADRRGCSGRCFRRGRQKQHARRVRAPRASGTPSLEQYPCKKVRCARRRGARRHQRFPAGLRGGRRDRGPGAGLPAVQPVRPPGHLPRADEQVVAGIFVDMTGEWQQQQELQRLRHQAIQEVRQVVDKQMNGGPGNRRVAGRNHRRNQGQPAPPARHDPP
jgi:hypothetical protein